MHPAGKSGQKYVLFVHLLPTKNTFKSDVSDHMHAIKTPVDCQSEKIIYVWRCKKENWVKNHENSYIGFFREKKLQHRFSLHSQSKRVAADPEI